MDDEQVKAVLAEFMGYVQVGSLWREDACGRPDSYIRTDHLPRYLTDYNAIADVWRRVFEVGDSSYGAAGRYIETSRWYEKQPRDHAHALAKAISQSKGD